MTNAASGSEKVAKYATKNKQIITLPFLRNELFSVFLQIP